jgi:hypothetical protein
MNKKFNPDTAVNFQEMEQGTATEKRFRINLFGNKIKVFIFVIMFGVLSIGYGQSTFTQGGGVIAGQSPVGINTTTIATDFDLHVDGQVMFENLNSTIGINSFVTWQSNGILGNQPGSLPLLGISDGQTLYWDVATSSYLPTDFVNIIPVQGLGIGTITPNDRLHLDESSGTFPNYALWTNFNATNGARIGQQAGATVFEIRQEENDDMVFSVTGIPVAYMNLQGGNPFLGVGTPGPLLPGIGFAADPSAGGPANWGWVAGTGTPTPVFGTSGDIVTPGDMFCNNVYIASDKRLKENITKLTDWKRIFEIQPYTYRYIGQEHEANSFGFLAQDVNQVLPELTSVFENNFGAVNYVGFVPFLLQGLQEHEERLNAIKITNQGVLEADKEISRLLAEIEALENLNLQFVQRFEKLEVENQAFQDQNQQLEKRLIVLEEKFNSICNMPCFQNIQTPKTNDEGTGKGFGQRETLVELPALQQNEPNPFSETTVIRYFLPEGSANAKIEVKNAEGKVVGNFTISQLGHGNITLASGTLSAGTYYYSLIINNNIVDTKKIVLLN